MNSMTRKQAQLDYLESLASTEFARQGFRGGIAQQAQIDTAARIARKALAANDFSPSQAVVLAVTYVRTARLSVAPAARTVEACKCGKLRAAHTTDFHKD